LRCRSGQSLVEFVLIAPLLLLLLFGIVEFARAWNIRHIVTDAAREGARDLVIYKDTAQARVTTETALTAAGLNLADATIDATQNNGGAVGLPATVSIQYTYQLGVVRVLLGWAVQKGQLNIATSFVMRNE